MSVKHSSSPFKYFFISALLLLLFSAGGCFELTLEDDSPESVDDYRVDGITGDGSWVFMVYMAGDNNLEKFLLLDVEEMTAGYHFDKNFTVLLFVDRAGSTVTGSTSDPGVFGEDFSDTRLYRLGKSGLVRLDGGDSFPEITAAGSWEGNTGDAQNLKKFITFAKSNYTADKYALVIWNHGSGPRGMIDEPLTRGAATDNSSSGDMLYTGEISDVLTESESVDLLGFDACYMSSIELAYQFRPGNGSFSADILAAAASEEWGIGWDYMALFLRIDRDSYAYSSKRDSLTQGAEIIYDPYKMNAAELGIVIAEELCDASDEVNFGGHAFAVTNLAKAAKVKSAFDALAVTLVERKDLTEAARDASARYFSSVSSDLLLGFAFYDTASLVKELKAGGANGALCDRVLSALDGAVLASFAGSEPIFDGFEPGVSGLSLFFPHGDSLYSVSDNIYWSYQWWYNPLRVSEVLGEGYQYGNLYWCADGAVMGNGTVENYFELLDFWYDDSSNVNGWMY